MASGTVVIDPGHGGNVELEGSSANNATSPSGVLEKNMTLQMALLVRDALKTLATAGGHRIKVILTRDTDKNVGLAKRAGVAKANDADVFLSIHFNASTRHSARGVETLVSPKARNSNHRADVKFAQRVQTAVFKAIKARDANTRDRKVKDQPLGVLNEDHLGKKVRGCLVEIEFIDVPAVDQLLNLNADAHDVKQEIAAAIGNAVLQELQEQ
jgi:N-acetylmuramoyl-L-alanine amidase